MRTPFLLSVHHLSKQLPGQATLHHTWRHHHHTGTYVVTVVHTLERPSGDETSETGNARVWDPASSLRAVLIGVSQVNLPDIIDPYVEYGHNDHMRQRASLFTMSWTVLQKRASHTSIFFLDVSAVCGRERERNV